MSHLASPYIDLTDDNPQNVAVSFGFLALPYRKSLSTDRSASQPPRKRKSPYEVVNTDDSKLQEAGEVNAPGIPSPSQPKRPLPIWGIGTLAEPFRNSRLLSLTNPPILPNDDVKQPDTATQRQLSKISAPSAFQFKQSMYLDSPGYPGLQVQLHASPHRPSPHQPSYSNEKRRRTSVTMSKGGSSTAIFSVISDDEEEEPITSIEDHDFESNPPEVEVASLSAKDIVDIEKEEAMIREEEREERGDYADWELLAGNTLHVLIPHESPQASNKPRSSIICPEDYLSEVETKRRLQELNLDGEYPYDNSILSCQKGAYIYTPGDGVEFRDGSFMRIQSIHQNFDGEVQLIGRLLIRGNFKFLVPGNETTLLMPKRRNEVIWTYTQDKELRENNGVIGRNLKEAVKSRDIIFTNQSWPNVSEKIHKGGFTSPAEITAKGPLFCRWKHVKIIETHRQVYETFSKLIEEDADLKYRIKSEKLRFAWRRCKTYPGGSFIATRRYLNEHGDDTQEEIHCFTFGDAFCGAGGTSRGAIDAGLHVAWGVDCNADAAGSWRSNFASKITLCYQQGINEFIQNVKNGPANDYMVDILHMSPPCQPFSPAHTTWLNIENDETNEACLLVVKELLEALKPRIVTMEETAGLFEQKRNKPWFAWVIRSYIEMGYGVRWTIAHSEKHGLAQRRRRLLIIAAGPGEKLPPFPSPSHGEGCKKPLFTIRDAIGKGKIPQSATHQATISQFLGGPKPARLYTWNQQVNTLTCGGGSNNYHPSGKRPYTIREIACLQGFPWFHDFATDKITIAKRQIGNAFPPPLAKSVYKEIIKSLKETDGI